MDPEQVWFTFVQRPTYADRWQAPPSMRLPSSNYWHYLIGYLAPIAGKLRSFPESGRVRAPVKLLLLSASPHMDAIADQVLTHAGFEVTFWQARTSPHSLRVLRRLYDLLRALSPWRKLLPLSARTLVSGTARRMRYFLVPLKLPESGTNKNVFVEPWDCEGWWWDHSIPVEGPNVLQDMGALRDLVAAMPTKSCLEMEEHSILLLRRPSRKTPQRDIANAEQLSESLRNIGVNAVVYMPVEHSFGCQVATFARARMIIGVRGAEFANMLWMKPGSRAVMVQTPMPHASDAPQVVMADLLGLSLTTEHSRLNDAQPSVQIIVDLLDD